MRSPRSRPRQSPARHNLFGLIAESSVDLSLPPASHRKDVDIVFGTVPVKGVVLYESAEPAFFGCYRSDDVVVLQWENARFSVTRESVVIDTDHRDTAAHLLVPAVWSVVLAANARESLHGSAVSRHGVGIAILGHSGSGKSTAAWKLIERGWRLVSDDLLTFDANLRAIPGPPWLRFLPDSGAAPAHTADPGGKLRRYSPTSSNPVTLGAIVIMHPECRHLARIKGTSAVSTLLQQVYNPVLIHPGQAERRFDLVHALANRIPIYGAPPRSLSADQLEDISQGE